MRLCTHTSLIIEDRAWNSRFLCPPPPPSASFFFSISLFNHALLSLPPSGIVALHLCYLTPSYAALLMQLFNTKQPALFFFFLPCPVFFPMQPLFVSPLFLQLFRAGTTDPRRDCYYKPQPQPPPSRWSVFALSLSLFCYRHHRRFFFSLWMFFDWMRGERVFGSVRAINNFLYLSKRTQTHR